MIKAIIFDCFGVIVTDALASLVEELHLSIETKTEIWELVIKASKGSITPEEYRTRTARKLGISVEEYIIKVKDREVKNLQLLDLITELKLQYKIGMLSNVSSKSSLEDRFSDGELAGHFDEVVASAQIGYAKPEAQAYEIIADKLGVRLDECIMIDDRKDYCEGASAVGMKTILYQTLEQMELDLLRYQVNNNSKRQKV